MLCLSPSYDDEEELDIGSFRNEDEYSNCLVDQANTKERVYLSTQRNAVLSTSSPQSTCKLRTFFLLDCGFDKQLWEELEYVISDM